MDRKTALLLIMSITLAVPLPAAEKTQTVVPQRDRNSLTVTPGLLGGMVIDRKVRLMMRDGTYVEGKVLKVSETELTLRVKKSEPKGRVPKPEATIPTADIGVVNLYKGGTIAVPIALGIVGGFLGGMAGAYAGNDIHSEGGYAAVVLLGMAGGATGGAVLGSEAAKKTIVINVAASSSAFGSQPPQGSR